MGGWGVGSEQYYGKWWYWCLVWRVFRERDEFDQGLTSVLLVKGMGRVGCVVGWVRIKYNWVLFSLGSG